APSRGSHAFPAGFATGINPVDTLDRSIKQAQQVPPVEKPPASDPVACIFTSGRGERKDAMATRHDVAQLARVGVGTASRALSGNGAVARETRIRVHEAAAKLNFRPSSAARALSHKEQGLIGIMTPQFDGLFFGQALNIAEREIRKAGKHLMVASSK